MIGSIFVVARGVGAMTLSMHRAGGYEEGPHVKYRYHFPRPSDFQAVVLCDRPDFAFWSAASTTM
jgi:hypothetical protein